MLRKSSLKPQQGNSAALTTNLFFVFFAAPHCADGQDKRAGYLFKTSTTNRTMYRDIQARLHASSIVYLVQAGWLRHDCNCLRSDPSASTVHH
ncbi:hypothetical protein DER45DRAFT_558489 [Fusarium avenaceum]|nr:hypothetical protein DER45DRAFT_558489 [Fusarium avenaceum]